MAGSRESGEPKAVILEIQRMSTEDGPGIRTTVFFKGCSLKCRWCHNPESISPHPQVHWIANQCILCKSCVDVCPQNALTFTEAGNQIDRTRCDGCGVCTHKCPSGALELLGKTWALRDLVSELVKDRAYFEKSGGGVTLSGGEATLQVPFALELLKTLKEKGIHTALDTCGMCSRDSLLSLLPYTDLLLFDLKEIDSEKHRDFTGAPNEIILKNLIQIGTRMKSDDHPAQLWIRTPIIPNATDRDENIRGIGRFITRNLNGRVSRWELNAFNNLCKDKYRRLNQVWAFEACGLLSRLFMEKMTAVAKNSGVDSKIVCWNGSTRLQESHH